MATDVQEMTMSDLKDLEPLSKRLNAASNELQHTLQTIQERLNTLAIGLEAWCDDPLQTSDWRDRLDQDSEPTGEREYDAEELGYGRDGEGWALLVRTRRYVEAAEGPADVYDEHTVRPLLKATRALRVAAVPLLPQLIDAIEREALQVIERVEQAKKIADSLK